MCKDKHLDFAVILKLQGSKTSSRKVITSLHVTCNFNLESHVASVGYDYNLHVLFTSLEGIFLRVGVLAENSAKTLRVIKFMLVKVVFTKRLRKFLFFCK